MPVSLEQYLGRIAESGLIAETELREFLSSLAAAKQPQDAEQFARELVRAKKLTPYQAQQSYQGKGKSLVLGNYVVLDKLGQGGMGMVLKAEHRRMERVVALKILSPAVTKTPEVLKRFQQEVKVAARLTHPNIATAYDADVAGNTHFLVMEYVEGSDLASLVAKEGRLSVPRAVNYILQAARGLAYAHGEGVIHRDIKPANLLLDKKGTLKILDMGLARIEDPSQAGLTQSGEVMGTVDYMAPEQALDTRRADARADIYSLGCTLYRLLTAENMFEGETMVQKLMAHQQKPIPNLTAIRADVPAALASLFARMVAKKPEDRYQTMAEVEADLAALASSPATANSNILSDSATSGSLGSFLQSMASGGSGKSIGPSPAATTKGKLPTPVAPVALAGTDSSSILSEATIAISPASDNKLAGTIAQGQVAVEFDTIAGHTVSMIATPTPKPKPKPKGKNKSVQLQIRVLLIAAGFAALALSALGVWVIVKNKDGQEIARLKVPEGSTATVTKKPSKKPASTSKGASTTPSFLPPTTSDAPMSAADQQEREIAEWLIKTGSSVQIRNAANLGSTIKVVRDLPQTPFYIDVINLTKPDGFSKADAEKLAKAARLTTIYATNTTFQAGSIAALKNAPKLRTLSLVASGSQASPQQLQEVLEVKQLKSLSLVGSAATDDVVSRLGQLPNLERLDLQGSKVYRDQGIELLAKSPPQRLVYLNLKGSKIGRAGVKAIATLPALEELGLEETGVDDESLQELIASPLIAVALKYSNVSREGATKLNQATNCQITGLPSQMPDLYRSQAYRQAIRHLQQRGYQLSQRSGLSPSRLTATPVPDDTIVAICDVSMETLPADIDDDLKAISQFRDLSHFWSRNYVPPSVLNVLAELPALRFINLQGAKDAEIWKWKSRDKFKTVGIAISNDDVLRELLNLPSLHYLALRNDTVLSQEAFNLLSGAKHLRTVAGHTRYRDHLQKLANERPEMQVRAEPDTLLPQTPEQQATATPILKPLPLRILPPPPLKLEPGFVPLFDGESLAGWQGSLEGFRANRGSLECSETHDRKIYTTKEYSDFILKFEYQGTPGVDGGVAIRMRLDGGPAFDGLEMQILDETAEEFAGINPHQRSGGIWGVVGPSQDHLKPLGEWNACEITAQGRQVKVVSNGIEIVNLNLDKVTYPTPDGKDHPGLKRTIGHICIWNHINNVTYRNLQIKELK
ncbi:Serine/threonine-protein kinase PrkC [Anatilimnocola aggregata]|uniref:non-specific serine/threonine protein kinase n=1 Tax=Anatilimnocola aggregata TaxID=2528021 RepID=A0A517Y8E5_9BACT|nr:protein kinase [Anatilimnocola aggregata]QDU26518.1 Serine/threonine-protein kinase PrkC [Anatilimnocola aggregata]